MKSFKILIAAAMSAALLAGCAQKEVITGIDKSKAGVTDFAYDETMSSTTSVSLVWNPEQALKAGATSFSVQLAKQEDFSDATMYKPEVSMYKDTPQGQTIQADADLKSMTVIMLASGLTIPVPFIQIGLCSKTATIWLASVSATVSLPCLSVLPKSLNSPLLLIAR